MRIAVVAVVAAVLALALGGCGDEQTPAADDPAPACPTFAVPSAGEEAYARFIVGVDESVDVAALLAEVGGRLCLDVTLDSMLPTGDLLVVTPDPLGAAGQDEVVRAFEKADGVSYAEPDLVVGVDPVPAD